MTPPATGFIHIEALTEALGNHLKELLQNAATAQRVFGLHEGAEYCGHSRDRVKKKVIKDHLRKLCGDKWCRFYKADLDPWIDSHKLQIREETAV